MHPVSWQLQEAKQRFSELVRRAESEGPQVVTRHGQAVVVVVSSKDYEGPGQSTRSSLKELLLSGPSLDVLDLRRDDRPAAAVHLQQGDIPKE